MQAIWSGVMSIDKRRGVQKLVGISSGAVETALWILGGEDVATLIVNSENQEYSQLARARDGW